MLICHYLCCLLNIVQLPFNHQLSSTILQILIDCLTNISSEDFGYELYKQIQKYVVLQFESKEDIEVI